jgi:hypothetical protein
MSEIGKFRAVIENAGNGGAYVKIPFDVEKVFGKKRVKVKATIEGQEYSGSLVRMGSEYHILIVLKEIREKIEKSFGDEVEILVEEDMQPRKVAVPPDLIRALESEPQAETLFNQLSYSHQKAYIQWIDEAKREQTRLDRVDRAVKMLKDGKKEH